MTKAEQKAADDKKAAKAAKFVDLAQKRTTKAINSIRAIRKLANRNNYVFTDEQINKIGEALRDEVVQTVDAFSAKPEAQKEGFKL